MFATKTKCYKSQAKECAKSGHRWQGAVRNIVVARHVGVGGMSSELRKIQIAKREQQTTATTTTKTRHNKNQKNERCWGRTAAAAAITCGKSIWKPRGNSDGRRHYRILTPTPGQWAAMSNRLASNCWLLHGYVATANCHQATNHATARRGTANTGQTTCGPKGRPWRRLHSKHSSCHKSNTSTQSVGWVLPRVIPPAASNIKIIENRGTK